MFMNRKEHIGEIMELTFYDRNGKPVAYTTENIDIYAFNGTILAYIEGDSVYSFSGKHLGWYIDYSIIDHNGYYFLFTEKSMGGPFKPFKQLKPIKGFKQFKPFKGFKQYKPYKPYLKITWSNLTFEQFFEL